MFDTPKTINPLDRKAFWLSSYPKSGNTWVRMFLNSYITGFPVNLNSAYQFVSGDFKPEIFQMMVPRALSTLTLKEQMYYYPAVIMNVLNTCNTTYTCIKTHHAKVKVDDFPLIPSSLTEKAIYIIRDPRDVVSSLADHFGLSLEDAVAFMNNPQQGAEQPGTGLTHLLLTWSLHVESWTKKNTDVPFFPVKYEELIGNPRKTFQNIITAFDFELDEERFDFALEQSKFKNLQKVEAEGGFREKSEHSKKFFREGKAGNWKKVLPRNIAKEVERNHKDVMQEFGYL